MPNYCCNRAVINAPAPVIAEIKAVIEGNEELLAWMVPQPNFEGEEWYNWRIEHWGTKWDVCDIHVDNDDEEDSIEISFNTAWAPPTEAFQTWAINDGRVQFSLEYWEPGCGFVGCANYDGEYFDDTCYDVGTDPVEYRRIATDVWGYEEWEEPEPLTEWYKQGVEDKGLEK